VKLTRIIAIKKTGCFRSWDFGMDFKTKVS